MSPNVFVMLPSCPTITVCVPLVVFCATISGRNAGYNPILVGVFGTNVPYVAEYSCNNNTSPSTRSVKIVMRGPSAATT